MFVPEAAAVDTPRPRTGGRTGQRRRGTGPDGGLPGFLPLIPDAGIDEGYGGDLEIPRGLDCFEAWLAWLETLAPVARAAAEAEGSGCFPWVNTHVLVNPEQFLPYAPLSVPGSVEWGSDCCEWSRAELLDRCPPPPYGETPFWWLFSEYFPTEDRIEQLASTLAIEVDECDLDTPNCASFDRKARELLETAWALLRENTDLVEWALCVAFCGAGPQGEEYLHKYACIQDFLTGRTPLTIKIQCNSIDDLLNDWLPQWVPGFEGREWVRWSSDNNTITFDATDPNSVFERIVEEYCGGRLDGELYDKYCLAIYMASVLLAQMLDGCGMRAWEGGACHQSVLSQRTLLWALLQRYPVAMYSDCCDSWSGGTDVIGGAQTPADDLFLSDRMELPGCV